MHMLHCERAMVKPLVDAHTVQCTLLIVNMLQYTSCDVLFRLFSFLLPKNVFFFSSNNNTYCIAIYWGIFSNNNNYSKALLNVIALLETVIIHLSTNPSSLRFLLTKSVFLTKAHSRIVFTQI
jgi:hypothetical protein